MDHRPDAAQVVEDLTGHPGEVPPGDGVHARGRVHHGIGIGQRGLHPIRVGRRGAARTESRTARGQSTRQD